MFYGTRLKAKKLVITPEMRRDNEMRTRASEMSRKLVPQLLSNYLSTRFKCLTCGSRKGYKEVEGTQGRLIGSDMDYVPEAYSCKSCTIRFTDPWKFSGVDEEDAVNSMMTCLRGYAQDNNLPLSGGKRWSSSRVHPLAPLVKEIAYCMLRAKLDPKLLLDLSFDTED